MTAPHFALLYAPNDTKAEVLADFAARRAAAGVQVDGVLIETVWLDPRTKGGLQAHALGDGRRVALTRPYAEGIVVGRWQLLPEGVAAMAEIVAAAAARGCDLLVVDKFGPLEGRGEGMAEPLATALAAEIPLVVAVRQEFAPAWRAFVAERAPPRLDRMRLAPTDAEALEDWWRTMCAERPVSAPD
jgi:nucleoside-triphosphatase THEP1